MPFGSSLAGSARVVLGVDTREFNRDLTQAETHFTRATRGMDKDVSQLSRGVAAGSGAFRGFARSVAFASGAFLGAAGFTAIVRQSVTAASDLNESLNKTNATFKASAPAIRAWAESAAHSLGMSEQAALENAASVGAMLIPMNFARGSAAGMSKAMVQLASDMGSFNNQDPTEMLDRIRAGLAGETEPLRRFGVDLRVASVNAFALETGILKQGQALSAQGQVWARYQLLLKQTKDQQGDFARTADGAANAQRTLRASITEAEAALGKAFIPTLERLLPKLTGWADKLANNEDAQQRLADGVERAAGFVEQLAGAFVKVAGAADKAATAVGGFSDAFRLLVGGALAVKLAGILGLLGGPGGTGKGGILGMMTRLKGLGPVALVVSLSLTNDFKDQIKDAVDKRFGSRGVGTAVGSLGTSDKNAVDWSGVGALQIPTSFKSTHQTSGLAGFPAVDIFADPGTPILAPENGTITRTSGGSPEMTPAATKGYSLYFVGDETGNTYFITHLAAVSSSGYYHRGDIIGVIAAGTQGGSHAHVGVHKGVARQAYMPSTSSPPRPTDSIRGTRPAGAGGSGGTDVTTPGDLVAASKPKKKKKKKGESDDPVLNRLYLRLATAEDTKLMEDDLKALQALDVYLSKKIRLEKKVAEKTKLIKERQGIRGEILDVEAAIRDAKPLPKPVRIPGVEAVLGQAAQLASGTALQDIGGGLGKVLVGHSLQPTVQAWTNMIGKLKKKLLAALGRRRALAAALKRLGRIRGKLRDPRLIQWHQQQLAALDATIAEIRGAIGEAMAARSDLVAEATSKAQEDADEAERADIRRAAADEETAAEDAQLTTQLAEEFQQSLVATPAETRLALARAEGTADTADDLVALRTEEARLVGNQGRGNIETEIQIVNALNSVRGQIERLTAVSETTAGAALTLVDQGQNQISFLNALRSLRSDQSNLFDPLAEVRRSNLTIQNFFPSAPEAHLWSKDLEFELKALVA